MDHSARATHIVFLFKGNNDKIEKITYTIIILSRISVCACIRIYFLFWIVDQFTTSTSVITSIGFRKHGSDSVECGQWAWVRID